MPKSRLMGLRWVFAPAAAIVAVALFCAPAWAVYPGTSVVTNINQAPYQVEVVKSGPADAPNPTIDYCYSGLPLGERRSPCPTENQ